MTARPAAAPSAGWPTIRQGVNMGLLKIESAKTLEEAMRLANLSGSPAQNFVVADDQRAHRLDDSGSHSAPRRFRRAIAVVLGRWQASLGRVALAGGISTRRRSRGWPTVDGQRPGRQRRHAGHAGRRRLRPGSRAQQIRDDLRAVDKATEADMLRIQLDDRAVFLERWRKLLLDVLIVRGRGRRSAARRTARSTSKIGVAMRRWIRSAFVPCGRFGTAWWRSFPTCWSRPASWRTRDFAIAHLDRTEGPVWRLVSERPEHLDRSPLQDVGRLAAGGGRRGDRRGQRRGNRRWHGYAGKMRGENDKRAVAAQARRWPITLGAAQHDPHPASAEPGPAGIGRLARHAGPGLAGRFGKHAADSSAGDGRVATDGCLARARAGRLLHMPCGQSGHPLSPHYRDEHASWAEGKPEPFLPGESRAHAGAEAGGVEFAW